MQNSTKGFAFAFGSAFLFSTKPILIKWMYGLGVTALPLLALRMMFALPLYLVIGAALWHKMSQKPALNTIVSAAFVGLFGYYLASFLDLWGLEYVSAQLERIVLYAYPTFVVILAVAFLRKPVQPRLLVSLLCTYLGIALIYSHELDIHQASSGTAGFGFGVVLILLSALSFAIYVVLSKRYISALGSLFFTCVSMTAASLASIFHYGIVEGAYFPPLNLEIGIGVAILVIFSTVIPTFMTNAAIQYIGPERVGISATLGPLITTALAVVYLGEPFGLITALGMILVIFGVSLIKQQKGK